MIQENREALYAAFKSRDARFDGRFFVGVRSTGIYCRPVCRVRLPKPENCLYFRTAAEAEQAGFRPCLRCRPELAPGLAPMDAAASLAQKAARLIEEQCGTAGSLAAISKRLGCTERHLRRVFSEAYHVPPVQYLQTCRLLLAKSLLTDTDLSVLEVAMAAGFGSLRRFNDVFKERYRLAPAALRRQEAGKQRSGDRITLALGYRPPFQWERLLAFLSPRAIPGVETIQGNTYYRTVRIASEERGCLYGWIGVTHQPHSNSVSVTVAASLLPVLPQVLSRVRCLFDLSCEPEVIQETLSQLDRLKPGLFLPGIRVPGCFDPFEMSVRAVLGQQISVKAATTLSGRFARQFGEPVETGIEGLSHVFPTPESICSLADPAEDRFCPLGITGPRARTIRALAELFSDRAEALALCIRPEDEVKRLMRLPGIGAWTAQYIAMRALGWTDAFPDTDLGLRKALAPRSRREILELAEMWRPWRAYAAMCLWQVF